MTDTKHTPGPWVAFRNSSFWEVNPLMNAGVDGVPYTVADCCSSDPGDTTGLQQANAHLIAAAPELLEALGRAELILTAVSDGREIYEGAISQARAAIAKAKGETK